MDINFLLLLQNFRESSGQWLAPILNNISKFTVNFMLIIPIVIFWAANRETGYWALLNLGLSDFVNNIVKLSFCIYRPWVRDTRVTPWGDSVTGATGYSFPSGHSVTSAAVFGGAGWQQRKKRKWLAALLFLIVLIIGFSRLYLGVHTPQDVLVAILEASLIIAFNTWLFNRIQGNEKKQDQWTAIGFVAVVLAILYIQFKSYPLDYVDGVLLMDPQVNMKDAFQSIGVMSGFLAGSLWERKRIHYDPSGTVLQRIVRCIIGIIPALFIYLVLRKRIQGLIGLKVGSILTMFLFSFYVIGIFPFLVMKIKAAHKGRAK